MASKKGANGARVKRGAFSVRGFTASAVAVGIKKGGKKDLALILSNVGCAAAGVFTRNAVRAAPVVLCEERLWRARRGGIRGVVINSGIANVCTGKKGMDAAKRQASAIEACLGLKEGQMLVASTGRIGAALPVEKIEAGAARLVKGLRPGGFADASEGIMTTDTFPKRASVKVRLGAGEVTIAGMAKGAGMICPDMATMLAFFMTDCNIKGPALRAALVEAADASFNSIAVDNDTSTNDSVIILANSLADAPEVKRGTPHYRRFSSALAGLSKRLALMIVEDGEGATKLVEITVRRAASRTDAKKAARTVATSMLVKTALFGEDPNWGRFMAALGRAGARLRPERVDISFNGIKVVRNGVDANAGAGAGRALKKREVRVVIDLKTGVHAATFWTTDLSYGYVRENSQYST